jgi:hypothetical protein
MLVRHQRSQLLERELTRGAAEAGGSRFVESLTTRVTAQRGREDERAATAHARPGFTFHCFCVART